MRIVPTVSNTKLCPDARFEQAKYNERPLSRDPSYYKGTSGRVGMRFRTEIFRSARRVLSIKHTPTTRGTGGQHAVSFLVEADRCWPRSNRQRRLQLLDTRAHTRPRRQQHRYANTRVHAQHPHANAHKIANEADERSPQADRGGIPRPPRRPHSPAPCRRAQFGTPAPTVVAGATCAHRDGVRRPPLRSVPTPKPSTRPRT